MSEEEIGVFIDATVRYFDRVTGEAAAVDTPFLQGEESVVLDFTGVIGISGRHRGAVYFTSGQELLDRLLDAMGEPQRDAAAMGDLVGEVANTISGSARRVFGSEFLISVPIVLRGRLEEISFPRNLKRVVIPIRWRDLTSYLIVCLDRDSVRRSVDSADLTVN